MAVILSVFASTLLLSGPLAKIVHGPKLRRTTCDEFSKLARFNPNTVLGFKWLVFYYWASEHSLLVYSFHKPTKRDDEILHRFLDGRTSIPVNWTATRLVMVDNQGRKVLLVERNDRGHYWWYSPGGSGAAHNPGEKYKPYDVRLKQKGAYIGLLNCKDKSMYVMSKVNEVPAKNKLIDAAATMGFRMPGGRSYLYEGHGWMPIPEAEPDDGEKLLEKIRAARAGEL